MNNRFNVALTTGLMALFGASSALAAGDAAAGKAAASACVACHQPGSFAGKSEDALVTGIQSIVAGKAAHPPVGKLSAEDIANIAAFYAAAD
jgi:mono/diheme cytochrome c family protein